MKKRVKIGETQLAMSELKMSMREIKDHNLHADGWNEGYAEGYKEAQDFIWKELSLVKEPVPSANDSKDYNKGMKNGFDCARAFISRVIRSI